MSTSADVTELERGSVLTSAGVTDGGVVHALLANSPDFVCEITPDGRFKYINKLAPGYSPEDVIGHDIFEFLDPRSHEPARACIARVLATGTPDSYESEGSGARGELAYYDTRVSPIRSDGRITSLILVARDVTARVRLARELEASRDALRVAIDATGMGFWSYDVRDESHTWDERTCQLHGVDRTPESNEAVFALVHPDDRSHLGSLFSTALSGGSTAIGSEFLEPVAHRVVQPSGRTVHLLLVGKVKKDEAGRVVGLMGGALDISERHNLLAQLVQAQKMEAMGQLTAGLSHNFNNLLGVIFPALDLPLANAEDVPVQHSGREAAGRARDLIRQLMAFARPSAGSAEDPVAPQAVTERVSTLGRISFPGSVVIDVEVAPGLPRVRGGSILEQALLNLLLNACEAASKRPDGAPRVAVRVNRHPSGVVRFMVEDNGPGVSPAILDRLFQPFVTTKPVGRGTGLGLAVSRASLRGVGAVLGLAETSPAGARFEILAPAVGSTTMAAVTPPPRVLVVDDEAALRRTFVNMLQREGFAVVAVEDGTAAERALEAAPADVVLLDHQMPGMLGAELVPRLLERWPRLRIVLVSGFLPDPLPLGLAGSLHKPATREELVGAIWNAAHSG